VIITRAVTKRYGAVLAVDAIDLDVRDGDRYGLLGPNGSGKSTLVRMLLGLVYATSGEIEVLGKPVPRKVADVLPRIGALVEEPAAYPNLSGRANLRLFDAAGPGGRRRTRRARIDEALERVGLGGIDRRPVKSYSLGMRQRLGLAAALVRGPRLLILDEPGNGLDPRGLRDLRQLLTELNEAGTTIFLSSHLLGEVELLCTRVGVLDRGKLVLQQDLADLRQPTGRIIVATPDAARAVALLDGRVEARTGKAEGEAGEGLVVRHDDPAALNALLVGEGIRVTAMTAQRRSLEDVVLAVTGTGSDQVGDLPAGSDQAGSDQAGGDQAGGEPADGNRASSQAGGARLNGARPSGDSPDAGRVNGSSRDGSRVNGSSRQAGRPAGRDSAGRDSGGAEK
jgi:ABC-2 type transport system ATP-binding protein